MEVGVVVVVGHLEMVQNGQNGFLLFFLFSFFLLCGIGNSCNFFVGRGGDGGKAFLFFLQVQVGNRFLFPTAFLRGTCP